MKQLVFFVIFSVLSTCSFADQFQALKDAKNAVAETQQHAEDVDQAIKDAVSGYEDSSEDTSD